MRSFHLVQAAMPAPTLLMRALLSAGLVLSFGMATVPQAWAAEPSVKKTPEADTLPEVTVKSDAADDAAELPKPYAGGQVAKGGKVGLLGNKDVLDTPFNITNYTSQTIEDQQARSLSDLLINDPSVRLSSARTNINEDFAIRGFPVASQDVALNGMYGLMPYFRVPVEAAERVEVLKGPTALLNGMAPSGNIGGGINFIPKRAGNDPLTRFTGSYLSDSIYGGHADVGRRFGENKEFGVRFNGVYRKGDPNIDRQAIEESVGTLGLDYAGERLRLSADLMYQQQDIDRVTRQFQAGGGLTRIPRAPDGDLNYPGYGRSNMTDRTVALRGEYDLTDNVMVYGGFGTRNSRMDALAGNPTINNDAGDFSSIPAWQVFAVRSHSTEAGTRIKFDTGPVKHQMTVGVTRVSQNADIAFQFPEGFVARNSNLYNPVYSDNPSVAALSGHTTKYTTSELTSFALADTLSFAEDRIQLTLGARRQQVEAQNYIIGSGVKDGAGYDENAVTPVAGIVVKPWQRVALYANYIEGLSQGPTAPIGTMNAGQMFSPFKAKQREAGVKVDWGRIMTTLSIFEIERPSGITNAGVFSVNGEQRNRGVEFNTFGEIVDHVRLLGGVAYTDGRLTKTAGGTFDDNYAIAVPKVQANIGAEWDTLFVPGLTLIARTVYTSSQYVDQANNLSLPQWTRIDIGARYKTQLNGTPVTLRANVDNLFDKAYWGSSNFGYLFLGAPRTLLLSATVDF
jgi:iron complex outermembrane receptor protein